MLKPRSLLTAAVNMFTRYCLKLFHYSLACGDVPKAPYFIQNTERI